MQILSFIVSLIAVGIAIISTFITWRTVRPIPKLSLFPTTVFDLSRTPITSDIPVRTFLIFHVRMVNLSTMPVQLIDYELEVRTRDRVRHKFRSHQSVTSNMEATFNGKRIIFRFTKSCFMNWPPRAVNYGQLEMGFLAFTSSDIIQRDEIDEYCLTMQDVFGRKYEGSITQTEVDRWMHGQVGSPLSLTDIMESAGVKIEPVSQLEVSNAQPEMSNAQFSSQYCG